MTNERAVSVHRTHARTSPASWIGERLLHSPGCVSRHAGSRPGITSSSPWKKTNQGLRLNVHTLFIHLS
eukprot:619166-Prymnesium_polylepis.1